MLFDLYAGGHHGEHLQRLVSYWATHDLPGRISLVLPAHFFEVHPTLGHLVERYAAANVGFVPIEEPLELDTGSPSALLRTDRTHGRLLRRYIERLRPDHCFLAYFDHVQVSLATGLRFDRSVRISGTYFRPSFHYAALSGQRPGFSEQLKNLRKQAQLRLALRNPHFDTLFCLDPFSVPHVQKLSRKAHAVVLPDGVETTAPTASAAQVREELGVAPERRMLLLFGALARRKGIFKLLDALGQLTDSLCERACVVLAGAVDPSERESLNRAIATLSHRPLQIILCDDFITDQEMHNLFAATDVALLPYQHHIGSSGVLIRAAAVPVPVIGADYGVIGAHIRQRNLGLAVDATDAGALANALRHGLTHAPEVLFDAESARRFAAENTADHFSETIFRHLLGPSWPGS